MTARSVVLLTALLGLIACDRAPVSARYPMGDRVEIGATSSRAHPLWPRYHRALELWVLGGRKMAASLGVRNREAGRINLHKVDDNRYVARADGIAFIVNVDSMTIMEVGDGEKLVGNEFLGAFDWDGSREWRFIPAHEREEKSLNGAGDA